MWTNAERRHLIALALEFVPPEVFKRESNILKRLTAKWGVEAVREMLEGAKLLKWTSLRGLATTEGIGRRMAQLAYHNSLKQAPIAWDVRNVL